MYSVSEHSRSARLALVFACTALAVHAQSSGYVFTHLAGSTAGSGHADGVGRAAQFHLPYGIAVGPRGDVFVADTYNQSIRWIKPSGEVCTLAGRYDREFSVDGTEATAAFSYPWGVTVDAAGKLYVCDTYAIRRFDFASPETFARATVVTVAGGGPGSSDGTGSAASFQRPGGIVAAPDGTLYVTDTYNHTIRKISALGVVTTLAGTAGQRGTVDGTGAAARFNEPMGITLDSAGNLYVADYNGHVIRKISPDGVVTTIAGTGVPGYADGFGGAAQFYQPFGLAIDSAGNLFVAERGNWLIRKITPAGEVSTLAGSCGHADGADGTGPQASFVYPTHLAIDAADNLYVAEYGNSQIRKITPAGVTTTLAGSVPFAGTADGSGTDARFLHPSGAALDANGNMYIADYGNHTIRKITPDGIVSTFAGQAGTSGATDGALSVARFATPKQVAFDQAGNLYVADGGKWIRKISVAGMVSTLGPSIPSIEGIAVDASGNVYATSYFAHTVHKITPAGVATVIAGSEDQSGSDDGRGAAARFLRPAGILVHPTSGDLYVADSGNNTIRRITSAGDVTTFAGAAGQQGGVDGAGSAARFASPWALAMDAAGNIFVGEGSSLVRKITPSGVVSTLGGGYMREENVDGEGRQARFYWIRGIAVDSAGALYLSDFMNNAVRKGVVPAIAWAKPGAIKYGMPLSNQQLNATTNIAGTFTYSPAAGAILAAGTHDLSVSFLIGVAPELPVLTAQVNITVEKADPVITWPKPSAITYGAALSGLQLRASANVPGTFAYVPDVGTVPHAGADQSLAVTFTPTDRANYNTASFQSTLTVEKAPLTATAVDRAKVAGTANPGLAVSYSGFVNGDEVSCIDTPPVPSTTATTSSPIGAYPITLTGGSDADYFFTLQGGTLTVEAGAVAPSITVQPAAGAITAGANVSFSVRVSGTPSPTLRWQESSDVGRSWHDLSDVGGFSGSATESLNITGAPRDWNGRRYRCVATNTAGTSTSDPATLTVNEAPSYAGVYFGPISNGRGEWALRVNADGSGTYLAYLRQRNSAVIARVQVGNDGRFSTTGTESATNAVRLLASRARAEHGLDPTSAELFTLTGAIGSGAVQGALVGLGETFTGSIDQAAGSAPNGYFESSATAGDGRMHAIVAPSGRAVILMVASRLIDAAVGMVDSAGSFSGATLAGGTATARISATSSLIAGTLLPAGSTTPLSFGAADSNRLINISTRAYCATGNSVTIGGFVVTGSVGKRILIRAVGPTLATQGIAANEVLQDPVFEIHHAGSIVAQNDNWGDNANAAEITAVARQLGATALANGDTGSAALLITLDPGVYTFVVKGKNNSAGIVLLEAYDADGLATGGKFVDIAARAYATTGNGVTVGGFVITGTGTKQVLVRAVGPTLATQGISQNEVLADPTIELHHGNDPVIVNDDWGTNANRDDIVAVGARIGATPFASSDTKSAALLLTLPQGVYTFLCKGKNDTSGIVLVEVYDAD